MIAELSILADAAMSTASGISPEIVGTIIAAVVVGLGGAGYGVVQRQRAEMRIGNDPLNVRNADSHYVTREQHDRDITRLYDQLGETSAKLNQIIGLVQGIRDAMTQRRPRN